MIEIDSSDSDALYVKNKGSKGHLSRLVNTLANRLAEDSDGTTSLASPVKGPVTGRQFRSLSESESVHGVGQSPRRSKTPFDGYDLHGSMPSPLGRYVKNLNLI